MPGRYPQRLAEPLPFAVMVLCVITGFLALDHVATASEQLALGAATWVVLLGSLAPLDRQNRMRALLVVLIATCAEVLGSIVIGAYTYRLENLPAFVPPGHGLVFLAGLRISQSSTVRRHERAFIAATIALIATWGVTGLLLLGRTDVLGAITGVALVYVLLRGRAPTIYAGVFCVVAFLEIYGTSIGAWHWAATTPGTPLPEGNPPSGIAGVYVLFDIAAIALAQHLIRPRALAQGLIRRAGRERRGRGSPHPRRNQLDHEAAPGGASWAALG